MIEELKKLREEYQRQREAALARMRQLERTYKEEEKQTLALSGAIQALDALYETVMEGASDGA